MKALAASVIEGAKVLGGLLLLGALFLYVVLAINTGVVLSWVANYFPTASHYKGVKLSDSVRYASAGRSGKTLKWLVQENGVVRLSDEPPTNEWLEKGRDVTILVHGYNALEEEIGDYFAPVIDYMKAASRRAQSFVVFDWPSSVSIVDRGGWLWIISDFFDSLFFDTLQFEGNNFLAAKEFAAGVGASGFSNLLDAVEKQGAGKITIVAHSMGSLLVVEALRQKPTLAAKIEKVVLLAPAVKYDVLEQADVASAFAHVGKVAVLYSRNDGVLSIASTASLSGMLGLEGPMTPSTGSA